MREYAITPVAKPRMTRRDRWAERKCVLRYRAFADEVRLNRVSIHDAGDCVIFVMPMPKSWSKKKRETMNGKPHQQKPDIDNLTKALLDSVFSDDSGVHSIRISKVWGHYGALIIKQEEWP